MVQLGGMPCDFKPMPTVGAGAYEIRVRDAAGAFRVIYVAKIADAIYVLHDFQKKTQKTAKSAEARVMAMRVELMFRLREQLEAEGWTQREAAKRLGVTQPRISAWLKLLM